MLEVHVRCDGGGKGGGWGAYPWPRVLRRLSTGRTAAQMLLSVCASVRSASGSALAGCPAEPQRPFESV